MTPTPELTIAIPIGPGYEAYVERSVESVKRQTIPVVGISYHDDKGMGPGFARNQLLAKCETPFIAFLDCGDWLEADFAAEMLSAMKMARNGRYVYSGWFESNPDGVAIIREPPERCYCFDNDWRVHLVTAVIPVEWLRQIGGFDETLPGMEDTDLFHKLQAAGHCGQAVPKPLLHYSEVVKRSTEFQKRKDYEQIKDSIRQKYHKATMNCCGTQSVPNTGPFNEKQPGDVLAEVQGAAFIVYVGRGTGRIYPKGLGQGMRVWAHPLDVQADARRFRELPITEWPRLETAEDVGEFMNSQRVNVHLPQAQQPPRPTPTPITAERLRQLARFDNE